MDKYVVDLLMEASDLVAWTLAPSNQWWLNEMLIASLHVRNLMAPDSFDNLGLVFKGEEGKDQNATPLAANTTQTETKK